MILQLSPPEHFSWIAERASVIVGPAFRAIEAIGEGGQIVGMVGFEVGLPNTNILHIAMEVPDRVPREVRRQALQMLVMAAFRTTFLGMWKKLAICHVLSTNTRSLSLVKRVGFREVYRGKDYFADGVDVVTFEMNRDEAVEHGWVPKE